MSKKIFKSIILVSILVLFSSVVFISSKIYTDFLNIQISQLEHETSMLGYGISLDGIEFLENFTEYNDRITIINSDGTVLFDNSGRIDEMDNHLDREEVRQALEKGYGVSTRFSSTLTERLVYTAIKLDNGWIVRLSSTYKSIFSMVLSIVNPLLIVALVMLVVASFLARRLAKRIVEPINEINIDNPDTEHCYKEIVPFMNRIVAQQQEIEEIIASLERSKQEFEAITENMNEGMLVINNKGFILDMNKFAYELLEIEERDSKIEDCLYYEQFKDLLTDIKANKSKKIVIKDTSYSFESSPVIIDDKTVGAVLLITDNSYKEANEKLRKEFSSNVSHELKTPLQSIIGYSELLKNGLVSPENQSEVVDRIYSESQRMVTLINDIIKLSRLDDDEINLHMEDVDLDRLIQEIIEGVKPEADSFGISISYRGSRQLVNGNPQLLESTVFNLIDNAIKYNRKNGAVDVDLYSDEQYVYFKVTDTGIGIPKSEYERIFERFYQVDKARSADVGGTGLGLSIVKHAVMLNNASISVDSQLNKGTTFIVKFVKV